MLIINAHIRTLKDIKELGGFYVEIMTKEEAISHITQAMLEAVGQEYPLLIDSSYNPTRDNSWDELPENLLVYRHNAGDSAFGLAYIDGRKKTSLPEAAYHRIFVTFPEEVWEEHGPLEISHAFD